jgi:hypothetical protein
MFFQEKRTETDMKRRQITRMPIIRLLIVLMADSFSEIGVAGPNRQSIKIWPEYQ